MKKLLALLLSLCLLLSAAAFAEGGALIPGTYTATGTGYSETVPVTVTITVDENGITAAEAVTPARISTARSILPFRLGRQAVTVRTKVQFIAVRVAGRIAFRNAPLVAVLNSLIP